MLRNKIKILVIIAASFLVGCSDYLSELPDNRTVIDSKEKISQLLTGAYPSGNFQLIMEIMSDNVSEKNVNGGGQLDTEMYKWEDSNLDDRDAPNFYWNSCYEAISQANQAIQSSKDLISQDPKLDLNQQFGEGRLTRAYAHFMLVSLWGKAYDPATANSDLGIPYILQPETSLIVKYKRNTVQEVYDLIEEDLLSGIANLEATNISYEEPKFHFTKDAAYAFAARFYLQKGNWDKVIEYSSKVLLNPSEEIRDMEVYRALSYSENGRAYANANEKTNILVASTSSVWQRTFASSRYGLSVAKANELFFSGAGNPFNKSWSYSVYGTDVVYNLPKYSEYFRFTNQSAGIGLPFVGIVLFDKDEVLLNRAEAYVMKENYNAALSDLTTFLSKKTRSYNPSTDILTSDIVEDEYPFVANEYTPFYSLTEKQFSHIKAISEYKRREYYHEGLRWFDIKRFHLEVTRNFDNQPITLTKNDNRREIQIPLTARNFGVEPNPR